MTKKRSHSHNLAKALTDHRLVSKTALYIVGKLTRETGSRLQELAKSTGTAPYELVEDESGRNRGFPSKQKINQEVERGAAGSMET